MTTLVTISVPAGANYKAEVKVNQSGTELVWYALPGTDVPVYVYQGQEIQGIREVPLTE